MAISKKPKPKITVVAGPTATGKTAYAIELAKKIDGEVISADSRQVYKGITLLSGKATKKEMAGVPHYLLDVADPRRTFSVARYKKIAEKVVSDILKRGKVPIICGGTGFYIDAIVYDQKLPEVTPNQILRKTLNKMTLEKLFAMLKKLDPARAKNIDAKNKVRLIRAIEIAKELGKVPKLTSPKSQYDVEWIYIDRQDNELKERIHTRLLERIKKGMLREGARLRESGLSWKRMEALGLECRSVAHYLQGKINKEELIEELDRDIWRYVKRQRTWFKKNKTIKWIKPQL